MKNLLSSLTLLAVTVAVDARGAKYTLTSSLAGKSFLDAFYWQAIADPTHGDVNYVDQTTAQARGLYSIVENSVILRADDTTVLSGTGPGRDSFALKSLDQYTTHVAIFDIQHMPEGCGTWPAIFGEDWPNEGEVDIVEGVNNQPPNTSTLHTSSNCTMPAGRTMTGKSLGTNCDVYETNNGGCGVSIANEKSFGPRFNNNHGGWYVIERSETYISIYFWERGSSTVPPEVSKPGQTVDTSTWGEPSAYFPNTDCDFSRHFGRHNIIINLTFCGDWAGNSAVYAASGCPSTCTSYVNEHPHAFSGAYFEFHSLNIYQ